MAPDLSPFVDVEVAVITLLGDLVEHPADQIKATTEDDLEEHLPFIRVGRIPPGTDDRITDTATIQIDVFGAVRCDASGLAELVRQRLLNYPHIIPGIGVLDRITTVTAPRPMPWGESGVHRYTGAFSVRSRRR